MKRDYVGNTMVSFSDKCYTLAVECSGKTDNNISSAKYITSFGSPYKSESYCIEMYFNYNDHNFLRTIIIIFLKEISLTLIKN